MMWLRMRRAAAYLWIIAFLTGCAEYHHLLNLEQGIHYFKQQKYHDAFVRLKPEAVKGQPDAEYAIGYMYYYGQGITEDRSKAIYWIQQAACAGQPDARNALHLLAVEYVYSCQHHKKLEPF
jgi:FOG: TPR repeat, SEL1 subfamily